MIPFLRATGTWAEEESTEVWLTSTDPDTRLLIGFCSCLRRATEHYGGREGLLSERQLSNPCGPLSQVNCSLSCSASVWHRIALGGKQILSRRQTWRFLLAVKAETAENFLSGEGRWGGKGSSKRSSSRSAFLASSKLVIRRANACP